MLYRKTVTSWQDDTILQAKQYVGHLTRSLGITDRLTFRPTDHVHFHPKKQGDIYLGEQRIGYIGTFHPFMLKAYKIGEQSQLSYFHSFFS